uniref:RHS repeat domain-containing protein n=1 Tax=Providencia stuartii TaxID=588 RepID=UPI00384E3E34
MRCFTPSGDVWRYTYDAFGRRLSKTKTVDNEKHNAHPAFPALKPRVTAWHYLWSGDQMVEEAPVYADGTVAYDAGIQWLYQPGPSPLLFAIKRGNCTMWSLTIKVHPERFLLKKG